MKFKECLEIFEVIFNTLNHILIGITTFYMTWYCFHVGFDELITYHVLLTTIGVSNYTVIMNFNEFLILIPVSITNG